MLNPEALKPAGRFIPGSRYFCYSLFFSISSRRFFTSVKALGFPAKEQGFILLVHRSRDRLGGGIWPVPSCALPSVQPGCPEPISMAPSTAAAAKSRSSPAPLRTSSGCGVPAGLRISCAKTQPPARHGPHSSRSCPVSKRHFCHLHPGPAPLPRQAPHPRGPLPRGPCILGQPGMVKRGSGSLLARKALRTS